MNRIVHLEEIEQIYVDTGVRKRKFQFLDGLDISFPEEPTINVDDTIEYMKSVSGLIILSQS